MSAYTIRLLDCDGYTIAEQDDYTNKRKAIIEAKSMLADKEYSTCGVHKVEVLDCEGEVEWDEFI